MRRPERWMLTVTLVLAFFVMDSAVHATSLFPMNSVVRKKCIACHMPDEKGRLEVLEETRKTPEEWKVVVDRMIALDGASLDDAEFNPVIKELS
ncbi:MAG: hypothetical protein HY801_04900, partial [Candidatus Lindowbacteria bacterium]|nr:hypothetical protein [Candidatus Lindowbacteria bacterium]